MASHPTTTLFIYPKQIENSKRMFNYITYSAFGKACCKSKRKETIYI